MRRAATVVALAIVGSCSRVVPELDGFTAVDVATQRTRVLHLASEDPRSSVHEGTFRAGLAAGGELEARLVVGCGDHVSARSRWVSLASHMDTLRRDLR